MCHTEGVRRAHVGKKRGSASLGFILVQGWVGLAAGAWGRLPSGGGLHRPASKQPAQERMTEAFWAWGEERVVALAAPGVTGLA